MRGIDTLAKYAIALAVIIGCFVLIGTSAPLTQADGTIFPPDNTQPWSILALIVGWLIRDSAGNSATANVERIAAAQPTTTTTNAGPPVTSTTVRPSNPDPLDVTDIDAP